MSGTYMVWDRKKQNYWISRKGNPWRVKSYYGNQYICDYPAGWYDTKLVEKICFASNTTEVKRLVDSIDMTGC